MVKEKGLIDACRSGNAQQVEKILNKWKKVGPLASLRKSWDVNIKDQNGYSALHHASLNGFKEIVNLLLGYGASPNVIDGKGSSPLHLAAWAGHSDVVKLLLTYGHRVTLVNLTNVDGDTPLHYATQFGHTQCCQLLLKHGADPAVKNSKGEAPLDLAAFYGRVETVEAMLRTHPELIAVYQHSSPSDIFPSTPLHLASRNGHKAVVDLLIGAGMPPTVLTPSGTALHEASLFGKVEVAKRLVELGIDITAVNCNGETAETLLKILGIPTADQILKYIQGCGSLVQVLPGKKREMPFPNIRSPGSPYENILLPENVHPKKKHNRSSSVDILLDEESGKVEVDVSQKTSTREAPRRHHKSFSSADSFKWSSESEGCDPRPPSEKGNVVITPEHARRQITRGSRAYSSLNYGGPKEVNGSCGERRSLDYLPMHGTKSRILTKLPPQKPPRKVNTSEVESMNRRTAYELIYMAHSGAIDGVLAGRNSHQSDYVDMSRMASSCYENIDCTISDSSVNQKPVFDTVHRSVDALDMPVKDLGDDVCASTSSLTFSPKAAHKPTPLPRKFVSKSYEDVLDDMSSPAVSTQPSTPDHPPPPPQSAEDDIIAQLPKRKSRDIETETDVAIDLSRDASISYDGLESISQCDSEMDLSVSVDHIEEYVTDSPFEGLVRCSLGRRLGSFADTLSLPTPSGMTHSPSKMDFGTNTDPPRKSRLNHDNSLAILSPFDEHDEWAKITEILGSFGEKMGRDSILVKDLQKEFQDRLGIGEESSMNPETQLGTWLKQLGCEEYEGLLQENGFDDLNFLGSGLLDEDVLLEIGVVNAAHRQAIAAAASQIQANFAAELPTSVEEWLASLNLRRYAVTFQKNFYWDMEKVAKLWEIELVTVLEVVKCGHIRRILFSLGAQNRFAPKVKRSAAPNNGNWRVSDSGLVELGLSVEKLKEEINKKLPEDVQKKPYGTIGRSTLGRKKNRPPPPPIDLNVEKSSVEVTSSENISVTQLVNVDDLPIRDPKDLLIGSTAPGISQWKHKVSSLVNDNVRYTVEYLGTTRVLELKGTESTKRSIQKLKKKYAKKVDPTRKVVLAISHQGVNFLHPEYEEAICEHSIRNIHCACQDADDLTHFAYITQDQLGSSDHFCHVFRVDRMDLATEIILTLGQAFEVAFQLALKDERIRCHIRSKSVHEISRPSVLRGHGRARSVNGPILTDLKATTHAEFV